MWTESETEVQTRTQATRQPEAASIGDKKKRRKRKWIWIGVGISIAILVVVAIFGGKKTPPILVSVEKVQRRNITQVVSATGKIYPEVEVKLAPEVSGEIVELPVKDGDAVRKGQLLFRINPEVTKAQVEQAAAALSAAKAQSLQAKAQRLLREDELRRATELYKQKLISESEYLTAQTNAEVAKATYEASLFDIQRLESQLRQQRENLSRTTVYSPIDGHVTLLNSKLGERVVGTSMMTGTEVMRVADLNRMEIRVDVNENDIVNVKKGDTARIIVDAYPNQKFAGVVYEIANMAKTTGAGTQDQVTNFEVKIRILDHQGKLRPGMSATADIETATVLNALAAPIQSVTVRNLEEGLSAAELAEKRQQDATRSDDKTSASEKTQALQARADREKLVRVVFVKEGDIARIRKVETGIADNAYMEIKSGVKEGEEVISGPYRAVSRDLKDSSKVALESPTTKR
ncbi:MAG: efflux RND transporter periplasmic adaptor subunit [Chloroherpetonaceae bacterium]|nr:efflux RND transporter periplasmic adaptor subunit [Chloroherpetonaceae bacterium]MDW8437074.1 efflux RND transporter periplasmic adaptor subunit [Chloroherpetonaceae bacterium]